MIKKLENLKEQNRLTKPLIHCITNPISIHDCANIVLASGARPIMAEHPLEVAEITSTAQVLALNLGRLRFKKKFRCFLTLSVLPAVHFGKISQKNY